MFILKHLAGDFIVKEELKLKFEQGNYSYYLLKKENLTTHEALSIISKSFHISLKNINIAGLKDKKAVTFQYISVYHGKESNLNLKNLSLEFLGKGKERLKLGLLESNNFSIIVRNLDKNKKYEKPGFIENYYDEQRFSKNNKEIGKALIKRDFKKACSLLNLEAGNPLNSLSRIKNLKFYLHSYQSYLFNEYLSKLVKNGIKVKYSLGFFAFSDKQAKKQIKNIKIPLLNFDTDLNEFPYYKKIMKKENLKLDDFIIRQVPSLIDETKKRDSIVKIRNLKVKYEKDNIFKNKLKAVLSFSLPSGSYATILIKKMFNEIKNQT